ncbi:hypothetical protein [Serratia rubidaea]|uniref:hypothetical protein n=1 Tax=Serratia rubidaea TaxID=61652 RepID=UPI003FA374C9
MKNNVLNQDVKTDKSEIEGLREQLAAVVAERDALAVENAELKSKAAELVHEASEVYSAYNATIRDPDVDLMDMQTLYEMQCIKTPGTDAALAAIRDKSRAEGINFAANRLLAAFEHGFIDKPAGEVADVAKMILSAVTELPGATEDDFTRDYSDEVIALIHAELREGK